MFILQTKKPKNILKKLNNYRNHTMIDTDIKISAILQVRNFKNENELSNFGLENHSPCETKDFNIKLDENDGTIKVEYVEIIIDNFEEELRFYISKEWLKKVYTESKVKIDQETSVGFNDTFTNYTDTKTRYKISLDQLYNKLGLNKIKLKTKSEKYCIDIDIISNIPYFFDFVWEDIIIVDNSKKNCIRYIFDGVRQIKNESDQALLLVSRGHHPEGNDLKESIKKEINNFFVDAIIGNNRKLILNKLTVEYFFHNKKLFNLKNLFLLHIIGHGDRKFFIAENEHTETSPNRYCSLSNTEIIDLFSEARTHLFNLSYCDSSYNDDCEYSGSLSIELIKNRITNYVVSSRFKVHTDFLNKFNNEFYNYLFYKENNVEKAFFYAKNTLNPSEKNKNILTLFKCL